MPKQSDIVGTICIPEAGYGRFWNFMKTMPGAEFTPALEAKAQPNGAKRTHGKVSEGTTGKCIVLAGLGNPKASPMTTAELTAFFEGAGKSKNSIGNVLHELIKLKHIKRAGGKGGVPKGYAITDAGMKFRAQKCNGTAG